MDDCPEVIKQPVAFFARYTHMLDHTYPIYLACQELGIPTAGFWVSPKDVVFSHAARRGWDVQPGESPTNGKTLRTLALAPAPPVLDYNPVVVAGLGDFLDVRRAVFRPMIAAEHGAGMFYIGDLPAHRWTSRHTQRLVYKNHGAAINLRFSPNEFLVKYEQKLYLQTQFRILGDEPKMDRWRGWIPPPPQNPPVVCLSSHFHLRRVHETWFTLDYYERAIPLLKEAGFQVIGHCHPRGWGQAKPIFQRHDVEMLFDFEDVLERADVYCTSGSSTIYEFASVGKPVVPLRAPFMRKDINHGLLFWDAVPGEDCWTPEDLPRLVERALEGRDEVVTLREEAVSLVFPQRDGQSAKRAAERIARWQADH